LRSTGEGVKGKGEGKKQRRGNGKRGSGIEEGAAMGYWLPLSGREDMTEQTEIVIVNWERSN
jgi:hypothetical protein